MWDFFSSTAGITVKIVGQTVTHETLSSYTYQHSRLVGCVPFVMFSEETRSTEAIYDL